MAMESIANKLANSLNELFETPEEFEIFTTIRYDPSLQDPFFKLDDHVQKLKRACSYFQFQKYESLETFELSNHLHNALKSSIHYPECSHRVKLLISQKGNFKIEFAKLPPNHKLNQEIPDYLEVQKTNLYSKNLGSASISNERLDEFWTLYLDKQPTVPNQFTSFKTTNRKLYDASRKRFDIVPGDKREVLMYDMNDYLLEGSITSIAVWRLYVDPVSKEESFKWITPQLSVGCMDGVMRKLFLDNEIIVQGIVSRNDLIDGEFVLIMNALMGVKVAKLVL